MTDLPPPTGAPAPALQEASTPSATPRNVLGIVALAVSAIGFVFACIPGALIVGWVLLPIGFVLGIVALFLKGAKWPAITAVIVSVVGTIIGFVVFFSVVANAVSDSLGGTDSGAPPAASSPAEPAESAAAEPDASAPYVIVINGATQTVDYEGKPTLVVDFTFTNNSDQDANFMFAASAKAFQDGVQLEDAILMDDSYDPSNSLKDLKPGVSIDVQNAYVLTATTDVTVEVTELISFDDTLLATKTFTVQ